MDENKKDNLPVYPDYTAEGRELVFAAVLFVLGLITCNFTLYGGFNLGFALGAVGLILASAWYLRKTGGKFGGYEKALLGLSLLMALGFARSAWGIKFWIFLLLVGSVNLALILAAGQNRRSPDRAGSLLDAPRALFVLGMGGMGATSSGLARGIRGGGAATRKVGAVTTGLLISAPLLLVMIALLMSADAAFEGIMELLPDFDMEQILHTILWGTLLAWLLYSRGLRLAGETHPMSLTEKEGNANPLTVNTVLIMVDLVYVVYLISQLAYLSGGLAGILPEAYTVAEYARRGFFEMAWLCAINLGTLCLCMHRIQREKGLPPVTKIAGAFLGAITIFLVITASAKMLLYIGRYGLTPMRILTEVFMLWLAITTVLVTLRLFRPQLPYMKAVVLTGLILATLVFWLDANTMTARYNLKAYQTGKLETIDVWYLRDLGPAGVPALIELTEDENPEVAEQAADCLNHAHYSVEDFRDWNYTQAVAENALEAYREGLPKEE